jgi:shikimate dehydrogenase
MTMTGAPTGRTRLFPIFGDPVIYARSPEWLTLGFAARGHNAMCVPMEVPEAALTAAMAGFDVTRNIDGLLVTMPHKFAAFRYCATFSTRSEAFSAVSVMRRNADGSWHGDMLDGLAFVKAQKDAGAQVDGAKCLLLGVGGAGSAIAMALLEAGVRDLVVHDINGPRADALVALLGQRFPGRIRIGRPDPEGCAMVCNATPLGMAEGDPLPLDAGLLTGAMFVGDVIAGHGLTPFLAAAEKAGCSTANGDQMVVAVQEMMLDFMLDR